MDSKIISKAKACSKKVYGVIMSRFWLYQHKF